MSCWARSKHFRYVYVHGPQHFADLLLIFSPQVAGDRTRQANDAKQAAMERSAAIRKIEQDMIELGRLYQEVAELVQQQEPAVEQINRGAEDVVDNVNSANKQLGSAVTSARKARKLKWIIALIIGRDFQHLCGPEYELTRVKLSLFSSSLVSLSVSSCPIASLEKVLLSASFYLAAVQPSK